MDRLLSAIGLEVIHILSLPSATHFFPPPYGMVSDPDSPKKPETWSDPDSPDPDPPLDRLLSAIGLEVIHILSLPSATHFFQPPYGMVSDPDSPKKPETWSAPDSP